LFNCSRGNFAARYGGKEFVVVILGTSIDETIKGGEDIRSAVEELRIPSGVGNKDTYLTISVRINSVIPLEQMSSDELVRSANFALYQAKTSGRKMVKVYNKVVENT
jgi:diguanylate cyclase (GGDEF)-like protein